MNLNWVRLQNLLPFFLKIQIICSVDGKEQAIKGKIKLDLEWYKEFLLNILNNYFT
jgi:hypothetical protein